MQPLVFNLFKLFDYKRFLFPIPILVYLLIAPSLAFAQKKHPDFQGNFQLLMSNERIYRAYDDSLHQAKMTDAEWMNLVKRRAAACRKMYDQNNKTIEELVDYFRKVERVDDIPAEDYDAMLNCVEKGFNSDMDNFLIERFSSLLLPYYISRNDTANMVRLYFYSAVSKAEISRFHDKECGLEAKRYFEEIMSLADNYTGSFPTVVSRLTPLTYMNYCCTLSAMGLVSAREAYERTNNYVAYLESHKQNLDENQQKAAEYYLDRIRRTAPRIHKLADCKTREDSLVVNLIMKAAPLGEGEKPVLKRSQDSIDYYYSLQLAGKMPTKEADEQVHLLAHKLFAQAEAADSINEYDIRDLINAFTASLDLMNANEQISQEERITRTTDYCKQLVKLVHRSYVQKDPFFLEGMLGSLACNKDIYKNLKTDDKMMFMTELTVKSQMGTVVHARSMSRLSVLLFDALLKECPEEFVGIFGLNSIKELRAHKEWLKKWVAQAALYHDVGKIGISRIITNESRKFTAHERKIIGRHSELALEYLDVDSLFYQYKDIALGHHKWYDGTHGYPASFDNVASPLRAIIDVVTLCDCLEAATDEYYRNFSKTKPVAEVIKEFQKGVGTRYNPVMVNVLMRGKKLVKEIERVIAEEHAERSIEVRKL